MELVNDVSEGLVDVGTLGGEGLNVHLVDGAVLLGELLVVVGDGLAKADHGFDGAGEADNGDVDLGLAESDLLLVLGDERVDITLDAGPDLGGAGADVDQDHDVNVALWWGLLVTVTGALFLLDLGVALGLWRTFWWQLGLALFVEVERTVWATLSRRVSIIWPGTTIGWLIRHHPGKRIIPLHHAIKIKVVVVHRLL